MPPRQSGAESGFGARASEKGCSCAGFGRIPPDEVRIESSEKIELGFGAIEISGPANPVAVSGKAKVNLSAPNTLIVKPAQPRPPASYEAWWRAVGADSHSVKGAFKFDVRP